MELEPPQSYRSGSAAAATAGRRRFAV